MDSFWFTFPVILLLILSNGLFAMTEMAVMTARKVRLQQRAEEGDKGAQTALSLSEDPDRFLSTVQIGITLVGTLSSAVAGASLSAGLAAFFSVNIPALTPYAGNISLALIVLLLTYLSLVLGELVPKRAALTNPEAIAVTMAGPMRLLERLAGPVVHLLSISTNLVVRVLGISGSGDLAVTEEDVRSMLQQGEQVGVFEEAETNIVESVFRLGDRRVDSLMTPRTAIDWLDLNEPFEENLRRVAESPRNYFPLGRGSLDDVQGLINGKILLTQVAFGKPVDLTQLVQTALFVPGSSPAFHVLDLLRSASGNLALVIDEWGGVQGMVTLFDLMEAIVGAIPEAGQPFEPQAQVREDGSWLIDGGMNIVEFKDLLDLSDLPDEDRAGYQTVAGFILAQLGEIPTPGMHFHWNGIRFEVVDMDGLRVDKILVSRQKP